MSILKIVAIVLIVSGVLGLIYGTFTYPNGNDNLRTGPVEVSVRENRAVSIPILFGLGAIVVGGLIMFVENKKNDVHLSTVQVKKY